MTKVVALEKLENKESKFDSNSLESEAEFALQEIALQEASIDIWRKNID